jgi:hypothetical protein
MTQKTERVFELHWRQLTHQRWQAVLTDPETKLQYLVTSKLAFRTVLANLTAAGAASPAGPAVPAGPCDSEETARPH